MSVHDGNLVFVRPRDILVRSSSDLVLGEDAIFLRQLILRQRPRIRHRVLIFLERRRVRVRSIFSLDGR